MLFIIIFFLSLLNSFIYFFYRIINLKEEKCQELIYGNKTKFQSSFFFSKIAKREKRQNLDFKSKNKKKIIRHTHSLTNYKQNREREIKTKKSTLHK